jgi:hypothetical protein
VDELTEDPDEFVEIAARTGARYMVPTGPRSTAPIGVPGELVVRLRPTKVLKAFDLAE